MNKMDIVITMGGTGSRFRKAGYHLPKYMIEAKGRTLFEWSMMSLQGFADTADQYIFIAMQDETRDAGKFIDEKCQKLGIRNYKRILIDYLTEGQAATAMLAAKYWNREHGLFIYNIDTYVEAGEMNSRQIKGDGFLPCFQAEGSHWSFVRTDRTGKAVEIREKQRISEHCTVGAYYFKSCALFERLYEEYYGGNEDGDGNGHLVNGERYVAPLYHYLVEMGGEVYITDLMAGKVHVLGTPEELEEFMNEG